MCILTPYTSASNQTATDAALAYDRAAIALKGALALTNFPPPDDDCRQNPLAIRRLLEMHAPTDSEGSDGEEWVGCHRNSPPQQVPSKKRKRAGEGTDVTRVIAPIFDSPLPVPASPMTAEYMGVWRKAQVKRVATYCNIHRHSATYGNILQHTATR